MLKRAIESVSRVIALVFQPKAATKYEFDCLYKGEKVDMTTCIEIQRSHISACKKCLIGFN